MKLRELIAFLSCYGDLLDAEIEIQAIPEGLKVENLTIDEPKDLFGSSTPDRFTLRHDHCFDDKAA